MPVKTPWLGAWLILELVRHPSSLWSGNASAIFCKDQRHQRLEIDTIGKRNTSWGMNTASATPTSICHQRRPTSDVSRSHVHHYVHHHGGLTNNAGRSPTRCSSFTLSIECTQSEPTREVEGHGIGRWLRTIGNADDNADASHQTIPEHGLSTHGAC
jgi:hypothetical protein